MSSSPLSPHFLRYNKNKQLPFLINTKTLLKMLVSCTLITTVGPSLPFLKSDWSSVSAIPFSLSFLDASVGSVSAWLRRLSIGTVSLIHYVSVKSEIKFLETRVKHKTIHLCLSSCSELHPTRGLLEWIHPWSICQWNSSSWFVAWWNESVNCHNSMFCSLWASSQVTESIK